MIEMTFKILTLFKTNMNFLLETQSSYLSLPLLSTFSWTYDCSLVIISERNSISNLCISLLLDKMWKSSRPIIILKNYKQNILAMFFFFIFKVMLSKV